MAELANFSRYINKEMIGLEIGPSHNPITPKRGGWNVETVDHANANELREKYSSHGGSIVSLDNIEEVDYVWQGGSLVDLVGKPGHYDYIIASHVLEHTTDLVTFLQACQKLLKPTGKLLLALPDKRYCFDYFRPYSTTGDVLQAHYEKRSRHTPGKVFDYIANASKRGPDIAWSKTDVREISLVHDLSNAEKYFLQSTSSDEYTDIHNWMFTPASFRLIISDLQHLDLLRLSYVSETRAKGFEFFVVLSPSAPTIDTPRIELCQKLIRDVRSWTLLSYVSGIPGVSLLYSGFYALIRFGFWYLQPALKLAKTIKSDLLKRIG